MDIEPKIIQYLFGELRAAEQREVWLTAEYIAATAREEQLTEENTELVDEVRALDIALQLEIARRTVGGTAPGYQNPAAWSNVAVAPPSSASDEKAPPLRRALT